MKDNLYFISKYVLYFKLNFNKVYILILTITCKYEKTSNNYIIIIKIGFKLLC
jgi:hypothetical protein